MRYYRYGGDKIQHEVEASEERQRRMNRNFGKLVIDEDSIYEIDEECLKCRKGEIQNVNKQR